MIIYSRVVSRATWRRLTRPGCCLVLGVSRVPNRNFTYFRPVFLEWYLARPQQNLANLQMTSRTSQGSTWAGAHSVSLPQGAPGWRFSVMRPRSVFPRAWRFLAGMPLESCVSPASVSVTALPLLAPRERRT